MTDPQAAKSPPDSSIHAGAKPALLAKARALAPLLDAESPLSEAKGALTEATIAMLRGGDFFSLVVPECFGGAEADPVAALEVIEALSVADGCTGWVVMACTMCMGTAAAFLDDAAVREIFGAGRNPIIAGHGGPNGRAVVERGGFRLSGNWRYGSGIKHAEWVHSGAIVIEDGAPRLTASG